MLARDLGTILLAYVGWFRYYPCMRILSRRLIKPTLPALGLLIVLSCSDLQLVAQLFPQARTTTVLPGQFSEFMRSSPAPGTYQLLSGIYKPTYNNVSLFLRDGQFDGTAETPLVLQGEGPSKTIIDCHEVCYFTRPDYITFRNLTVRGYVNSDHMRHAVFENVTWEDPNKIGPVAPNTGRRHGILFKAAAAGPNDPDPGAGPITFIRNRFDPVEGGYDTALDFVGVQGVSITESVWVKCNRGCLQAKGGSGTVKSFKIQRNLILDAGQRGIFLGGATDKLRFDPPIAESKSEFGAADVSDNIILGGNACATFSTISGPVNFHHNFCRGATVWQIRLLAETAYPPFMEAGGFRNLTVHHNVFADWTGRWSNIVSKLAQIGTRWGAASNETIGFESNLWNTTNAQNSWPAEWAQEGNVIRKGGLVFAEDGRSVLSAEDVEDVSIYGPRDKPTEPPTEPEIDTGKLTTYLVKTNTGSLLFNSKDEALKAADGDANKVTEVTITFTAIEINHGN